MNIPTYLKHKPVYVVENYDSIDGKYRNKTDAKGLSLGLAQWSDMGNVDISAKVWRYTGEKWSRQSEELPLHRVLDLAILIIKVVKSFDNAKELNCDDNSTITGLIRKCSYDEIEKYRKLFMKELKNDSEILNERIDILKDILK